MLDDEIAHFLDGDLARSEPPHLLYGIVRRRVALECGDCDRIARSIPSAEAIGAIGHAMILQLCNQSSMCGTKCSGSRSSSAGEQRARSSAIVLRPCVEPVSVFQDGGVEFAEDDVAERGHTGSGVRQMKS
jgi:hypothetical protein